MKGKQMNNRPKSTSIHFTLLAVAGLLASAVSSHAQGAVATISGVPVSGGFDYTILLTDTGSTPLNSFWYGWTIGNFNLPSTPQQPCQYARLGQHRQRSFHRIGQQFRHGFDTGKYGNIYVFQLFHADSHDDLAGRPIGGLC